MAAESKDSQMTRVIDISDSSSNNVTRPLLPQSPNSAVKLSPTISHLRRCSKNKKKRRSETPLLKIKKSITRSIKGVFNAAFKKHSADRGVKKSSSWIKSQLLGQGAFGSVYLAKNKKGNDVMAIKTAEISQASSLIYEQRILTRLVSPYVVRCYGHEIAHEKKTETLFGSERTNYNLILEYCSGQSIFDLIIKNAGGLSEKDVKVFARDILFGLDYIHKANIIHCDIKPENILLSPVDSHIRPNRYVTKIADFGLAMEKWSTEYGNGRGHTRGTTRYMSPEHLSDGIVDYAGDIWAFGLMVLEMLIGKKAWGEHIVLGPGIWVNLIGQNDFNHFIPHWLSEEAQDFLKRCLVKNPGSRWGIGALMNHPFLNANVV